MYCLFSWHSCSVHQWFLQLVEKKPRKLGLKKNVKLVYAEVNPLDSIVGKTGLYFKEQVAKLSDGTVTIDIQASGVLGSENDVLDSILGGGTSIDMSRISAFALTSYGAEKSKLLSIPFTFENREHFWHLPILILLLNS